MENNQDLLPTAAAPTMRALDSIGIGPAPPPVGISQIDDYMSLGEFIDNYNRSVEQHLHPSSPKTSDVRVPEAGHGLEIEMFLNENYMILKEEEEEVSTEYSSRMLDVKKKFLQAIQLTSTLATERREKLLLDLGISDVSEISDVKLDPVTSSSATKELCDIERDLRNRRNNIMDITARTCKDLRDLFLPKRRRRNLSPHATSVLTSWYEANIKFPYPTDPEKSLLAAKANIKLSQVNNWFSNRRNRKWIKELPQ